MSQRFLLPVIEKALEDARRIVRESPTVDAAREQLGGRATSSASIGDVVSLASLSAGMQAGVVLFRDAGTADVWIGGGRVRRVAEDALRAAPNPAPSDLRDIVNGVRVFARLGEGDRVRYESAPTKSDRANDAAIDGAHTLADGLLVEKCRYGALVVTDSGKVMAIGFQSLWPAPSVRTSDTNT